MKLPIRHVHHSKLCLGKAETDTSHTALHIKLLTAEEQAMQAKRETLISPETYMTMKAPTAQKLPLLLEDQRQMATLATAYLTAWQT